jgi:hypothetical protein
MTKPERDLDEWDAEIEAEFQSVVRKTKAAGQRKKAEAFVKVPLWWIETAAKDARSLTTLILIELLYAAWKAKSSTFPLPNARLKKLGVTRKIKYRVLRNLERRPVILVERSSRKTPLITLIGL